MNNLGMAYMFFGIGGVMVLVCIGAVTNHYISKKLGLDDD